MPQPYPGLRPEQLAIARALAEAPEWSWSSHTVALRPDGARVEVMPGRALGMHRGAGAGLVPMITDPAVVGDLVARLEIACGEEVTWAGGLRATANPPVWWCALTAGERQRAWEGGSMGEVLGAALLARWEALRRRERSIRDQLSGRERRLSTRDRLSGRQDVALTTPSLPRAANA